MYACRAWLTGSTAGLGKLVACAGPGLRWLQHVAGCIELQPRLLQLFGSVTVCCLHRDMLSAETMLGVFFLLLTLAALQMLINSCSLHESWLMDSLLTIPLTVLTSWMFRFLCTCSSSSSVRTSDEGPAGSAPAAKIASRGLSLGCEVHILWLRLGWHALDACCCC